MGSFVSKFLMRSSGVKSKDLIFGISRITEQRNREPLNSFLTDPKFGTHFRPLTVDELYRALDHARMSTDVGCILLTGNGPSPKDGGWAFCSGGDQRIRGKDGYKYADG